MADEPSEDDRERGRLYELQQHPVGAPVVDAAGTIPTPPPLTQVAAPTDAKPGKRDSVVYFSVRIAPSTDPALIANDVKSRFSDPDATMHALNVWQAEDDRVAVLMRYHAKGANANDVRRRVTAATPVAGSQVEVTTVLSADVEVEVFELMACVSDLEDIVR